MSGAHARGRGAYRPEMRAAAPVRLGIRANLGQFGLLVVVNALVGAMLGQERAILPLIGEQVFGLAAFTTTLTFIAAFGAVKAATNLVAGSLADRHGRKRVLVAGWLFALPVPLLLAYGPSWGWIILANVLLGVNQGLAWSSTVVMKVDLAGSARRGLALGLNEAAGYFAVALSALATGLVAEQAGLRPAPFLIGLACAIVGLGLSAALVRDTRRHVEAEAMAHDEANAGTTSGPRPGIRAVALRTSLRDPALSTACVTGMVNNLNDGAAWGLFPLLFAGAGLPVAAVGGLVAVYPAIWGVGQLLTGPLSDRIGRKPPIVAGMALQAIALGLVAVGGSAGAWAVAVALLGVGTALVYPTLLAVVGDRAAPRWRASATGVYRTWRDAGFVVGALGGGFLADVFGLREAILAVAGLTGLSALLAAVRLDETHRRRVAVGAAEPVIPGD